MKYIYMILLLGGCTLMVSCEKILDKEPLGLPDVSSYYDIKSTYLETLTSVYDQVHAGYVTAHRPGVVGDAMSDDVNLGPQKNVAITSHYNYSFDAQSVTPAWQGLYQLISLANVFLEKVSDNQDNRSRLARGEAFFLRGFAYHELARWYGRAQIFTTNPTSSKGYFTERASEEESWNQALSDLRAAAERLPARYPDPNDLGRATLGAAWSYIAKSHLYLRNWDSVNVYVDKVKALGIYNLTSDYATNFNMTGENNVESIFEVQQGRSGFNVFQNNGENNNYLQQYGPRGLVGKVPGFTSNMQGGYEPTTNLFNCYAKSDKRIGALFILPGNVLTFDGVTINVPADLVTFKKAWSSTGIAPRKWIIDPSNFINLDAWNTPLNWKLFRYAELLLMDAEAANELNNNIRALESLNKVRGRAGISILTTIPAAIKDSIRMEYRRELAFEGHRFFQLVRWGTIPQAMLDRGFIKGKHELMPIPQSERDLNPKLDQNPNW